MANRSFEVPFTGWVASNPVIYRTDPQQPERAVTCFRAIHTPRYRDAQGKWRDGESLRVNVKCWGWAAHYAQKSIHLGDPVVVIGRLNRTRWTDSEGVEHFGMELTASSLGHDLTLGEAQFTRMRAGKPKESLEAGADQFMGDNISEEAGTAFNLSSVNANTLIECSTATETNPDYVLAEDTVEALAS